MSPPFSETVLGAAPVVSLVGLLLWMVRRSEARVSAVTDQFIGHLQENRAEAGQRQIMDHELHREYQAGIRANTAAIERLTEAIGCEVRKPRVR